MEQAGGAVGRVLQSRRVAQNHDRLASAPEGDGVVFRAQHLKGHDVAVEGRHSIEVGDEQGDGTHCCCPGKFFGHVSVNGDGRRSIPSIVWIMPMIDLNSDLGENIPGRLVSDDAAMIEIVTSANVSCGFHAGTPAGIRETLASAVRHGVVIGAHPGYRDYENFGRTEMDVDSATLQADVEYQLSALVGLAAGVGGRVEYVKPHGALYNTIAHDPRQAADVVAAIRAIDPKLVLLGLAGGVALDIASRAGLAVAPEAFADRAYRPDGQLVSRAHEGAVLSDPAVVAERMVRLADEGVIRAIDGTDVRVEAQSICVHGDSPGAVAMAAETKRMLQQNGITIAAFAGG